MHDYLVLAILFVVPWIATYTGSLLGSYLELKTQKSQSIFLGFAAGVMVAASIWSLIIPAFGDTPSIRSAVIATIGFVLGVLLMLLLDHLLPHQHVESQTPEGHASHLSRPMLLVMAVALHNIPEGIALGVVMAAALGSNVSWVAAAVFAVGLALQNFPEGMAVVVPLRQSGVSKQKARRFGTIASFAEPAAAVLGFFLSLGLTNLDSAVMPLMLSIAAGAMIFIVFEELIPASQSVSGHSHAATWGALAGFWIMAVMGILGG